MELCEAETVDVLVAAMPCGTETLGVSATFCGLETSSVSSSWFDVILSPNMMSRLID